MKKLILLIIGAVLVIAALGLAAWGFLALFRGGDGEEELVNEGLGVASFEECADAGYPILESFPRQCRTPDGAVFTEEASSGGDTTRREGAAIETPKGTLALSYEGGFLRLTGTLERNNSCVYWVVRADSPGGQDVTFNVFSEQRGEVCAQVISQQQVDALVLSPGSARVTVVFEGERVFRGRADESR